MTYIYKLIDPRNEECRYIGKTVNPKERYRRHIKEAKKEGSKKHLYCWIKSLLNENLFPKIEIIDKVDDWKYWEKYYICKYKEEGSNLTNLAEGGQGSLGWKPSKEWKLNHSKNLIGRKPWNTGKHLSEEHKTKIGQGITGRSVSKSTRERISIGNIEAKKNIRRFSNEDIKSIRTSTLSNRKLAKIYKCSHHYVGIIKNKKAYKDVL